MCQAANRVRACVLASPFCVGRSGASWPGCRGGHDPPPASSSPPPPVISLLMASRVLSQNETPPPLPLTSLSPPSHTGTLVFSELPWLFLFPYLPEISLECLPLLLHLANSCSAFKISPVISSRGGLCWGLQPHPIPSSPGLLSLSWHFLSSDMYENILRALPSQFPKPGL